MFSSAFRFYGEVERHVEWCQSKTMTHGIPYYRCIPLFIAMGLHLGDEIPEQIGIPSYSDGGVIKVDGKDIKIMYTHPLEDDPRLADLVMARANEFLSD